MRRGELLGLQWKDVDVNLGEITVVRAMYRLRDGRIEFARPKTPKGQCLIPLSPSAAIVLRDHLQQQKGLFNLLERPLQPTDPVFTTPTGEQLLPDTASHAWMKLVRKVGLKGIRLHDARHTHATLMLKQGIHPKIVSERLGHATVTTTLDTYSHVLPGLQQAAARQFDENLQPGGESQEMDKHANKPPF